MKAASRPTLVLAALVALLVLGATLAVGGLLALRDSGAAVVLGVATLAGLLAAGVTYAVARAMAGEEPAEFLVEPLEPLDPLQAEEPVPPAPAAVRPRRVDALPVASLPGPYVAAVMNGLQANTRALARERQPSGKQAGC